MTDQTEPTDSDLSSLEREIEAAIALPAYEDPLEDLYTEARLAAGIRTPRPKRVADPGDRRSLDAAAKKMRDLYNLPENWERTRGIALIDKSTKTLLGNFSEYVHRTLPATRKLLREHLPVAIDATEECEGYLGEKLSARLRGESWESERHVEAHLLLDELMVEAPSVRVHLFLRLGAIVRAELEVDTQFASVSGQTLLQLPAGTNIYEACGVDSKAALHRAVAGKPA